MQNFLLNSLNLLAILSSSLCTRSLEPFIHTISTFPVEAATSEIPWNNDQQEANALNSESVS